MTAHWNSEAGRARGCDKVRRCDGGVYTGADGAMVAILLHVDKDGFMRILRYYRRNEAGTGSYHLRRCGSRSGTQPPLAAPVECPESGKVSSRRDAWILCSTRGYRVLCLIGQRRCDCQNQLPNPAGIGFDHRLPRFAGERLLKLRHVLHHAINAQFGRRVGIGLRLEPYRFIALIRAPDLAEGQEKTLLG